MSAKDDPLANYRPVDGSAPSPGPWKLVPSETPYGGWIMDSTGGMVCGLFGMSDQNLLLHARALYEAALVAVEWIERIEARRALVAVLEKIEGSE
jgi:hypothetical protein